MRFGLVWFRVWVLGFCVMTWFNGMIEFWKILFNGHMMVLGNFDRTMNGYLRTPFVEGLGHHVVH